MSISAQSHTFAVPVPILASGASTNATSNCAELGDRERGADRETPQIKIVDELHRCLILEERKHEIYEEVHKAENRRVASVKLRCD